MAFKKEGHKENSWVWNVLDLGREPGYTGIYIFQNSLKIVHINFVHFVVYKH